MKYLSKSGDSRFVLVQRALLICTIFVCIITITWRSTPVLQAIYASDAYYISYGITFYLAVLLVKVLAQIFFVTRELELVKKYLQTETRDIKLLPTNSLVRSVHDTLKSFSSDHERNEVVAITSDTLDQKVARIALHAKTLVSLGFIGTLIGIMAAITGADLPSLFEPNANVGAILGAVVGGLKIAIGTSIVGVIAKMWIDHLGIILEEGTHHLAHNISKMEILK